MKTKGTEAFASAPY